MDNLITKVFAHMRSTSAESQFPFPEIYMFNLFKKTDSIGTFWNPSHLFSIAIVLWHP